MRRLMHISTWIEEIEEADEPSQLEDRSSDIVAALGQVSSTGTPLDLIVNAEPDALPAAPSRRAELLDMSRLSFTELLEAFPDNAIVAWAGLDPDRQLAVEIVFTGIQKSEWTSGQTKMMVGRLSEEIKRDG